MTQRFSIQGCLPPLPFAKKFSGDAAYDFFARPRTSTFAPGARCTVETGIACQFPRGMWLLFKEKSGLAHRYGLQLLGGVVDGNYHVAASKRFCLTPAPNQLQCPVMLLFVRASSYLAPPPVSFLAQIVWKESGAIQGGSTESCREMGGGAAWGRLWAAAELPSVAGDRGRGYC